MQTVRYVRSWLPVVMIVLSLRPLDAAAVEPASTLRVVGSTTVEKSILQPSLERIRAATGIELELKCQGTGAGLMELAAGKADASGASESMPEAINSAHTRAATNQVAVNLPRNLVFSKLGRDRIVVIVNARNTAINRLTKKQLKGIYTQKIVNWKELGGNDEPILVFTSPAGSATRALFQKVILDGANYSVRSEQDGSVVMISDTAATEVNGVAIKPNSIAAVSESVARNNKDIRIIEAPVVERPLGLITVGKPSPPVQKVIDYLRTKEGRKWEQE